MHVVISHNIIAHRVTVKLLLIVYANYLYHTIQKKVHDHLHWYRADVLRENTEAVFAACDAAHGRWAKLLGVRAALHPRLRLQEFLIIYNITEEFIAATENVISFSCLKYKCTHANIMHNIKEKK